MKYRWFLSGKWFLSSLILYLLEFSCFSVFYQYLDNILIRSEYVYLTCILFIFRSDITVISVQFWKILRNIRIGKELNSSIFKTIYIGRGKAILIHSIFTEIFYYLFSWIELFYYNKRPNYISNAVLNMVLLQNILKNVLNIW